MAVRRYPSRRVVAAVLGNETVTMADRWLVEVQDGAGRAVALEFDHDPTDDEIVAALPVVSPVEPTAAGGRRALFDAAAEAAVTWDALDRLNAKIQDPASGATNRQKTVAQALADRAYVRARRLVSDYADAVSE